MPKKPDVIHVAIPSMNEASFLPRTMECLTLQQDINFRIWVCVNQPDDWCDDAGKQDVCENNQQSLAFLKSLKAGNLHIIDHSSRGLGWGKKAFGVGQARKVLMDTINRCASDNDIIVSLDADTVFCPTYLNSVRKAFTSYPHAIALSNPYYHKLSGDEKLDRAMLRYEIYMRHYAINMWRIESPYSFTALGSAIALPARAYRKIGGITAKKSGEDFYFLQKLRKAGWICNYNTEKVYPGTRYSDRVFFGTGPALIKGSQGNWESYPVYDYRLFDKVKTTYDAFHSLFHAEAETPMSDFLRNQFREKDPFLPLRKNANTAEQFVNACHQKVDGLRVLQFLKSENSKTNRSDEKNLLDFFSIFYPNVFHQDSFQGVTFLQEEVDAFRKLNFAKCPVALLDKIRNVLRDIEETYQKNDLP
jgi:glycosyltransferase involved in cell wall biosynthesis